MRSHLLLVLLAAACGLDDARYVSRLAEADCTYALECFDETMLNFYGFSDQETCESRRGPELAAVAASCAEFDAKAGRECLKQLRARDCQGSGPDFDHPDVCRSVFASCEASDNGGGDEVDNGDSDA